MKTDSAPLARHVLVIVTDGEDNASHLTIVEAIAAAQSTATVIFFVDSTEAPDNRLGETTMKRLAETTGGREFIGLRASQMAEVFSEIKEQIDNMYEVTFLPSEPAQPGRYRRIELKSISDKQMKIRASKGYYSSEKPGQGITQP
jgi:VWFA-related protein